MPATPQQRTVFGAHLKKLREDRGLTIQGVVDRLRSQDDKLNVSKISAWERGEYAPSATTIIDMLEQFFDADGELHSRLGYTPPAPDRVDDLDVRVAAIERHLGLGQPVKRHLRAAESGNDPGPAKTRGRAGRPRPPAATDAP